MKVCNKFYIFVYVRYIVFPFSICDLSIYIFFTLNICIAIFHFIMIDRDFFLTSLNFSFVSVDYDSCNFSPYLDSILVLCFECLHSLFLYSPFLYIYYPRPSPPPFYILPLHPPPLSYYGSPPLWKMQSPCSH